MRSVLFACAVACLSIAPSRATVSASSHAPAAAISAAPTFALQVPDKKIEITVGDRGAGWYRSPVWIAIGVLALIVLVLLVVMLTRGGGGGTTIIRE
jgi:hypothetical protein